MKKFKQFNTIITLVEKNNIPKGTIGCIVDVYYAFKAYTCELFDEKYNTIGVYDYEENEIQKYEP